MKPSKENDPNSEHKLSRPMVTTKMCTKKEMNTDPDTCSNKDQAQGYCVKWKKSDSRLLLYALFIWHSTKDKTIATESRSVAIVGGEEKGEWPLTFWSDKCILYLNDGGHMLYICQNSSN